MTSKVLLLLVVVLLVSLKYGTSLSNQPCTLVLIDPFTPYLSGHCREYCSSNDIEIVEAVSPYTASILGSQGKTIPESFLAPAEGAEKEWAAARDLLGNDSEAQILVISESDAGVQTAERIQSAIGVSSRGSNGICPHFRNKFDQNERAKKKGLPIVAQTLATNWEDAEEFLNELWKECDENERKCIVKPVRGVASDGVFFCASMAEARGKFNLLLGAPKYGSVGDLQEAVLVQEFAEGTEYAVDTVTCDGETKVVALWRYEKFSANGAPFVYQCSELVNDPTSDECKQVMDYTVGVLEAQDLRFGPTHTEVKYTSRGPRLMEINARWHAQHFQPITQACLGNDALEITMDAFFKPERFSALPARPARFLGRGLILHLVSFQEGTIAAVRHEDTIRDLRSCLHLSVEYEPGMELVKTVDIRTDCGYVLLAHKDPLCVGADYEYICQKLQKDLFVLAEGDIEATGISLGVEDSGKKSRSSLDPDSGSDADVDASNESGKDVRSSSTGHKSGDKIENYDQSEEKKKDEEENEPVNSPAGEQQQQQRHSQQATEQLDDNTSGDSDDEVGQNTSRSRRSPRQFSRSRRRERLRASSGVPPSTTLESQDQTQTQSKQQQEQQSFPNYSKYKRSQQGPRNGQTLVQGHGLDQDLILESDSEAALSLLGQRILARIQRILLASTLLLGMGYLLSLATVLLLPSAEY